MEKSRGFLSLFCKCPKDLCSSNNIGVCCTTKIPGMSVIESRSYGYTTYDDVVNTPDPILTHIM